jgi:hypothetical protein
VLPNRSIVRLELGGCSGRAPSGSDSPSREVCIKHEDERQEADLVILLLGPEILLTPIQQGGQTVEGQAAKSA